MSPTPPEECAWLANDRSRSFAAKWEIPRLRTGPDSRLQSPRGGWLCSLSRVFDLIELLDPPASTVARYPVSTGTHHRLDTVLTGSDRIRLQFYFPSGRSIPKVGETGSGVVVPSTLATTLFLSLLSRL